MARFKPVQKGLMLLPVDFSRQIIPGTVLNMLCAISSIMNWILAAYVSVTGTMRKELPLTILLYCSRSFCWLTDAA